MKKNIKDYLPFYLGCECRVTNGNPNQILFITDVDLDSCTVREKGWKVGGYRNGFNTVKPILRPLSDMTDEEIQEQVVIQQEEQSKQDDDNHYSPIEKDAVFVKWFLSKHFDLFGLIEAGLAIDKTTLTT